MLAACRVAAEVGGFSYFVGPLQFYPIDRVVSRYYLMCPRVILELYVVVKALVWIRLRRALGKVHRACRCQPLLDGLFDGVRILACVPIVVVVN